MNENYDSKNPSPEVQPINRITSYFASGDGKSESSGMTNSHNQQKESGNTGWKMPEPVFRVSDGYCPLQPSQSAQAAPEKQQTNEKISNSNQSSLSEKNLPDITLFNVDLSDLKSADGEDQNLPHGAQKPTTATEQAVAANASSESLPENKSKNKTVFVVLTILGVFTMLFLAAAIIGVAYFWFYYRTGAG